MYVAATPTIYVEATQLLLCMLRLNATSVYGLKATLLVYAALCCRQGKALYTSSVADATVFVLILLCMCPHTTDYMCFLILLYMCPYTSVFGHKLLEYETSSY